LALLGLGFLLAVLLREFLLGQRNPVARDEPAVHLPRLQRGVDLVRLAAGLLHDALGAELSLRVLLGEGVLLEERLVALGVAATLFENRPPGGGGGGGPFGVQRDRKREYDRAARRDPEGPGHQSVQPRATAREFPRFDAVWRDRYGCI